MNSRSFGSLWKASAGLLAGLALVALSGCYYPYYYSYPYGHGASHYKHGYHGKHHYGGRSYHGGSYHHGYRNERRKRYRHYYGY